MAFAFFASPMMSPTSACPSAESESRRLSSPAIDLDAGQRVLDLVRDRRRHLAERREPVAQALALLALLDQRQVLEEQRRAQRLLVVVAHVRQRVADHLPGRLQPQLGAIGQVLDLEGRGKDVNDVRPIA